MGNPRAIFISLMISGLAVLLIWAFVKQQRESILELASAKRVVVANLDINELSMINETMLRLDTVPKSYVQPGTFTDMKDVVGLITTVPIKKGEVVPLF